MQERSLNTISGTSVSEAIDPTIPLPAGNYELMTNEVVLLGDSGVDKSNLLLRYTENTCDSAFRAVLGMDF